ncbi:MAG: hypothetical protein EBT86_02405 [Actinobacteria bacterium]|nr:hypothetical protein [Actinomycetota bacterium]
MIGGDLIDFRLLFQEHIIFIFLWVSVWGLTEIALDIFTGKSVFIRVLILSLIFLISSQALSSLAKCGEKLESDEINKFILKLRTSDRVNLE